jgi:hypothetical protein
MELCVGCGEKRFRHIQIDVEKCCSNKSELASYAVLWKELKRKNPQRKKNKECKVCRHINKHYRQRTVQSMQKLLSCGFTLHGLTRKTYMVSNVMLLFALFGGCLICQIHSLAVCLFWL